MNVGSIGNYGAEAYYGGKTSVGKGTKDNYISNSVNSIDNTANTSDGTTGAEMYRGMSFNDIFSLVGEKGNAIPTVNQIVTARNPDDGIIYRTCFTDNKITCMDAEGNRVWDLDIPEDQKEIVIDFFEGHTPYSWAKEIYSDMDLGIASSKDYWMDLFSSNRGEIADMQETEKNVLSKFQEVQLTDNTTIGISKTDAATECASVEKINNKDKVWTITVFGTDGISSQRCQNGVILDSWQITFNNSDEANRVLTFINSFDRDADLKFAGSKEFWIDFLKNDIDADKIFSAHSEVFDKASSNAPTKVKEAWVDAAKATGYLEGGKMNHISQLLIRQVINRENGVEDYQNVFGSSVASALQVAKELLYDLENPLTPISGRGENAREYVEQEKEFYRKFIENLEKVSK